VMFTVIVVVFVLAVLAIVAYAFIESTPFPHRKDNPYRDPRTHRRSESPHL